MKNILLKISLTAIVVSAFLGCSEIIGNSLIDNRFDKKVQVNDITVKEALKVVKFRESDSKVVFKNTDNEINDVINNGRMRTCSTIDSDLFLMNFRGKVLKNGEWVDSFVDLDIMYGQRAKYNYCNFKFREYKELNGEINEEVEKQIRRECEFKIERNRKTHIQINDNLFIQNIKPYNFNEFYNPKIFRDKLNGTVIVELTYKFNDKIVKEFLYEDSVTCEFNTRSREEVIIENKQKIDYKNGKTKKEVSGGSYTGEKTMNRRVTGGRY